MSDDADDTTRPLPTATNLQRLYEQLLEALIPKSLDKTTGQVSEPKAKYQAETINKPKQAISIEEKFATLAEIEALEKKLQAAKTKRDKEKQFNRRCELNEDYKALKRQLAQLQALSSCNLG